MGTGQDDSVDLKQQLIYMQMSIKELNSNIICLERKIDSAGHGIGSVEQQLLQMKQQQTSTKVDQAPSLTEIENIFKQNTQHAAAAHTSIRMESDQLKVAAQHAETLQRVEESLAELKDQDAKRSYSAQYASPENKFMFPNLSSANPLMEDKCTMPLEKPTAADINVRSQLRDELVTFQQALMKEFRSEQEKLAQHLHHKTPTAPNFNRQQPGVHDAFPVHDEFPLARSPFGEGRGVPKQLDSDLLDWQKPMQVTAHAPPPPPDVEPEQSSAAASGVVPQIAARGEEVNVEVEVDVHDESDDEDHTLIDTSHIKLKEDGGLASVFMNDDDCETPCYNVEAFYYQKGCCQYIARSAWFQNLTVGIVMFNAVYIGVDSDYNTSHNIYDADLGFQACSQFFCVYFTFELVVRFLAFETKRNCLKDGWFKFDTFLVVTMIMDVWMIMPALKVMSGLAEAGGGGKVTIPTQPLRMLRLFKLSRMARLMRAFPELVTMIKGLGRAMRAISSSMILVGIMVYTWAILLHMLLKEEDEFNAEMHAELALDFSTITNCMWCLLLDGTLMLDGTPWVMTALLYSKQANMVFAGVSFVTFSLLSALLILQMLIGVLCDVVSRVGQEQRDSAAIGLVKQELLADLQMCDNGDGKITQLELFKVMKNPNSRALLKKLNINRLFLMELQKMMFPQKDSQVAIKAILELMIMCRGDNSATVETLAGGFCFINQEVLDAKKEMMQQIKALQNLAPRERST